jgi:predicted nucleotidyltransferase
MVETLANERPDLLAVVLYGSVARGEERPLDDAAPSDVDLLVVLDTEDEGVVVREVRALFGILGRAYDRHLDAPRDVKVQFASRDLREWDATFVANVARDGRVLWTTGALPAALRPASRADLALTAPTRTPIPGPEGGEAAGGSSPAHG